MDAFVPSFFDAVTSRDRGADGVFFYGVKTTGVYCLPSCPARNPRAENTAYFATAGAAEAAGYRACKRCRPDGVPETAGHVAVIAAACRRIEAADVPPALAALAGEAKLSPSHFHRLFKAVTGVTPKAYAMARRNRRVRDALLAAGSVTEAVYEAGFQAPSRFYEAAAGLGMAPRLFKAGGAGQDIAFAVAPCRLGFVLVARNGGRICAISLGDDALQLSAGLAAMFPKAALTPAGEEFGEVVAEVVRLVDRPGQGHKLPLDIAGTAFQLRVWQALQRVKPGETVTYSELAALAGASKAVRAVAAACAANRLAVAIPCHRAIRADGGLAGYRWGLARKQKLLDAEKNGS
jgi:AraC family transcriptional regulator of adaptative response/methylated-DNA-[protein]-cysteine methyltransferase